MRVATAGRALIAAALGVVAIMVGCDDGTTTPADVVLRGGKVVTMDGERRIAQAVAVRDGRIRFVGSDADVARHIGRDTKVIELGGRVLLPGFVDAHLHALAGGRALLVCDLAYAPLTRAQLKARLQACLDATPEAGPDTWLEAVNWDRQSTAALDADPTRAVLDALPTPRPIAVTSADFHSVLANSRWRASTRRRPTPPAAASCATRTARPAASAKTPPASS
jgi:predicted amidohydrolase YtcJ